ncbi:tigger transposable element-derived protein 4-like [Belonocnema kinseyi]|uniref:tigger transposable element-derived protein 4-like n=1 Tax=Belonocnema kinseyi TaxID=2817044 RepID=UPI00143CFC9E|nr:tigger transposable element-derived protein 4-like [Belonocnema kinseyi]
MVEWMKSARNQNIPLSGPVVLEKAEFFAAHPKVSIQTLKAIKVVHLPINLTAKLQPMDQGIIENLRVNYRRRIIKRLLKASDEKMGLTDLNLLDAIFDLNKAWADVTSDTIANCFRKAGFVITGVENLATQEQNETLSDGTCEEWDDLQRMLGFTEVTFEEIIDVDTNVIIASEPTDSEILDGIKAQEPSKSDDDNDAEDQDVAPPTKLRDAEVGLAIACRFLSEQSDLPNTIFAPLVMVENFCQRKSCIKQKKNY